MFSEVFRSDVLPFACPPIPISAHKTMTRSRHKRCFVRLADGSFIVNAISALQNLVLKFLNQVRHYWLVSRTVMQSAPVFYRTSEPQESSSRRVMRLQTDLDLPASEVTADR